MKKVRLNLKRGSKPWSFTLYDSAESAFYLKDEPPYPDGFEEDYRKIVTLKPGEVLEVEWIGSEWVFVDDNTDFLQKPLVLDAGVKRLITRACAVKPRSYAMKRMRYV